MNTLSAPNNPDRHLANMIIATRYQTGPLVLISVLGILYFGSSASAQTTTSNLSGIVINEILVDPSGGSNNFDTDGNGSVNDEDEFVELYNSSGSAVDIAGWQLWDDGSGNWFTFPAPSVVQPGGFALVVVDVQSGGSLLVASGGYRTTP